MHRGQPHAPFFGMVRARWSRLWVASTSLDALVEGGLPLSSTGTYSREQCAALNRQRNVDAGQRDRVTQAIMCDTQPAACATEMLYVHEFYWSTQRARSAGGTKCATWTRDADWPTREPLLSRFDTPTPEGILQLMRLLPNKTLWFHGDSITTQLCEASFCSLMRDGAIRQPPFCTAHDRHPATPPCDDLKRLEKQSGMQLRAAALDNGARLLCSAVGVYEPEKIAMVLPHADVAMFNYGLHYHSEKNFREAMSDLFGQLARWSGGGRGRIGLYREQSAQHFRGGAWRPGADRPPPGTPCACEALHARGAQDGMERVQDNQNVLFNRVASELATRHGVGIVPFFNLTAARHDMHRRHFCSFSNQRKVGTCCDCTHFCYTPLFWDSFFVRLRRTITAHPNYVGPAALPAAPTFLQLGGRGSGGSAWLRLRDHRRAQLRKVGRGRGGRRGRGAKRRTGRGFRGGGRRARRGGEHSAVEA